MLLSEIMQLVRDQYTTETIEDAKLKRWIAAAVIEYSRWNPYLKSSTVTTINDQRDYTLPTDCVDVWQVEYWPSGGVQVELNARSEAEVMYARPSTYDDISFRVIEDIKQEEHVRRLRGSWTMENKKLCLMPVPAGDAQTVTVRYYALHALNATATGYDTIPAEDTSIIRDMTMAEIVEGKATEFSIEPSYSEGQQRIDKSLVVQNATKVADRLRYGCKAKYSQPVILYDENQ